tara:strand:- start:231 stop:440 length:210 start_codon:yes stop_codon:yes gene_type:complete
MGKKSKIAEIKKQIYELEHLTFPYDIYKGWRNGELWWRTSELVHPADSREWVRLHEDLRKAENELKGGG